MIRVYHSLGRPGSYYCPDSYYKMLQFVSSKPVPMRVVWAGKDRLRVMLRRLRMHSFRLQSRWALNFYKIAYYNRENSKYADFKISINFGQTLDLLHPVLLMEHMKSTFCRFLSINAHVVHHHRLVITTHILLRIKVFEEIRARRLFGEICDRLCIGPSFCCFKHTV